MRQVGHELTLSATDLSNFLGCRHRTALDMAAALGARTRPYHHDPLLDILRERGLAHEQRYVESLRTETHSIVELDDGLDADERVRATMDAMSAGADVIVQGGLRDGRWFGKPDVMRRVETPSALGDWSYEIADTKLARETRAGTILQLALYSDMLAAAQGAQPEHFHVVTPDTLSPVHTYRVNDYAAYFRLIRGLMLQTVALDHAQIAADNYPDPVEHCEVCAWLKDCAAKRHEDDHLSLVAGITRIQRRELESRSIATLTALGTLPLPLAFTPDRGSLDTYVRVREQARLQLESRGKIPPLHELLTVEPEKGLCRLFEPTPGDLFLDLEGDPFAAEGGREYLFGIATNDGSYSARWAFTEQDERVAFEWAIDTIVEAMRAHPGMHVYHYAPYEPAAFKRLMGRYATRERELDAMLRSGRFVDLYAVVRQALRAGVESYSIKKLEPLYGFDRTVELGDARRSLKVVELALEMEAPEAAPVESRDVVEGYNRDDCLSTLRLRDWLESVRTKLVEQGTNVPRRALEEGDASLAVDDKAQRVEVLRARLLKDVPELPSDRSTDQHGRWLLAYLLDYHRREDKATWWEYFRLCELAEEDLYDEREAVAGLELVGRVGVAKKSVIDRYRYPLQEMEIDVGGKVQLQDKTPIGEIVDLDRINRTIDVKKGPTRAELHPSAMIAFSHVSSDAMEKALLQLGENVANDSSGDGAARALLGAKAPRLTSGQFAPRAGESAVDFAVRISGDLDETMVAIQGPPGSGKTYCGARMICELIRNGKRVGITATSHKVIRNLLDAVATQADDMGTSVLLAHKCVETSVGSAPHVTCIKDNTPALAALEAGEANVLGGTAWLWACPEAAGAVDVLFVDEAGQMSLANVLAVSQAARSVVLLGDPRQLEQPRKGSHPEGVGASALDHILGHHQTIPAERGIFLPVTWRLAPSICAFTSELFYEGRLMWKDGLERQRILGVAGLPESGLACVDAAHDGNRNYAQEEIDVVADLVARLTDANARWVDADGKEEHLEGRDVLVVSPYNAQVSRLSERLLGTGVRVGTVDKFQGQEAPVVIYSMASSSWEDAPRGMEFLFSLNRLNVATSRARCLAIIVANPRLFEAECRSPRQMLLANAMCRYRELADKTIKPVRPNSVR